MKNHTLGIWFNILLLLIGLIGCSGDGDPVVEPQLTSCSSLKPVFTAKVLPVLQEKCLKCHSSGNFAMAGITVLNNAEKNFELLKLRGNDILVYGSNSTDEHRAGEVINAGSAEYLLIEDMTKSLSSCVDNARSSDLILLNPKQRLRKITLTLAGRLPTDSEIELVLQSQDSPQLVETVFDQIIDGILYAEVTGSPQQQADRTAFLAVIQRIYNDLLLLDGYPGTEAIGNFPIGNFTNRELFKNDIFKQTYPNLPDRVNLLSAVNDGLAHSALELISDVVDKNEPFTNILTADYIMVNSYTASMYDATLEVPDTLFNFTLGELVDAHDPKDFRRARLTDNKNLAIPHAGILTTPVFLFRYFSTDSNLNRGRSRVTFLKFLGVDIESLADRAGLNLDNITEPFPTFENAVCQQCHEIMDPIAGLYKNWSDKGVYLGDFQTWPVIKQNEMKMVAPGYKIGQELPAENSAAALQWLGEQIANDDRFVEATIKTVFIGLTGQPLPLNESFQADLKSIFREQYHLKTLVKRILNSIYFLATGLHADVDKSLYQNIGMGQLLIPEQLNSKIKAITGYNWLGPKSKLNLNDATYRILYGGIDSINTISRTTDPTKIMVATQERLALQTSCKTVAKDFAEPNRLQRNYFRLVDYSQTPQETVDIDSIKSNIQFLHEKILGEALSLDSEVLANTYVLFEQAMKNAKNRTLVTACRAGLDANNPIVIDEAGTVQAWMAVVAYLLSDYKFLYR